MIGARLTAEADRLREAFAHFDKSQTGFITIADLKSVLGEEENVEAVLAEVDENNDGQISFDEFLKCMNEGTNTRRLPNVVAKVTHI
jgi:calcium-dependent protein kinase